MLRGGGKELGYYEIGITKETPTGTEIIEAISEPLTITLAFDFTDKTNIVVYRYHGSDVDTLTTTHNTEDEFIDLNAQEGTIVLHVKNFCTYAIGYTLVQSSSSSSSHSTPSSYSITIPSIKGGTVSADKTLARSGSKITLTVKPDTGYHLDSLNVLDRNGKPVDLKDNKDGSYTFTMPSGKVTVDAVFKPDEEETGSCDGGEGCPSSKFPDLDTSAWYHEAVDYVIKTKLMQGNPDGTFAPNGTVTRAQMATVLWNMKGKPVVNYYMTYSDVSEEAWYAEAIRWATSEGIMQGFGNGQFSPDSPITREQVATTVYRYEQRYGSGGFSGAWTYRLPFSDLDQISDWAFEAVAWCNKEEIIEGKDNLMFDPAGDVKRYDLAVILMRYVIPKEEDK